MLSGSGLKVIGLNLYISGHQDYSRGSNMPSLPAIYIVLQQLYYPWAAFRIVKLTAIKLVTCLHNFIHILDVRANLKLICC